MKRLLSFRLLTADSQTMESALTARVEGHVGLPLSVRDRLDVDERWIRGGEGREIR